MHKSVLVKSETFSDVHRGERTVRQRLGNAQLNGRADDLGRAVPADHLIQSPTRVH